MTLTDFLLARIAEDAAVARAAGPDGGSWFCRDDDGFLRYGDFGWTVNGPGVETEDSEWGKAVADHIAHHDPARVLAECEAKRRIVERCSGVDYAMPSTHLAHGILAELALPYADHPDYREEWKP